MKLFCFDVDGTIRDNQDNTVPASNIFALKKLKEAGHKIVVATGRGWDSLCKNTVIPEIANWDGFVCNNGQILIDGDHRVIESHRFDPQAVEETIKVADSLNMPVILKMDRRIITR
ncbi:MAG: HAD family hydrolase, partial [bacterium]